MKILQKKNTIRNVSVGIAVLLVLFIYAVVIQINNSSDEALNLAEEISERPNSVSSEENDSSAIMIGDSESDTEDENAVSIEKLETPVENRSIITVADGTDSAVIAALIEKSRAKIVSQNNVLGTVTISYENAAQLAIVENSELTEAVEEDYFLVASGLSNPNDPLFGDQWAHEYLNSRKTWREIENGKMTVEQQTIAVIDSGVCLDHPDLENRLVAGWDFIENDDTPQDEYNHGCGVAGVIAANIDNSEGVAGLLPGTVIMPVRILDQNGIGTYSDLANAITYAVDQGVDTINMSLGGYVSSDILQKAVEYAKSQNVELIAAAGNTGSSIILYPAAYEEVMAVGSVDENGSISAFSSTNEAIDYWAPGGDIITTANDGGYETYSGTSFASPVVTVVNSEIVEIEPEVLGEEVNQENSFEGITGQVASSLTEEYLEDAIITITGQTLQEPIVVTSSEDGVFDAYIDIQNDYETFDVSVIAEGHKTWFLEQTLVYKDSSRGVFAILSDEAQALKGIGVDFDISAQNPISVFPPCVLEFDVSEVNPNITHYDWYIGSTYVPKDRAVDLKDARDGVVPISYDGTKPKQLCKNDTIIAAAKSHVEWRGDSEGLIDLRADDGSNLKYRYLHLVTPVPSIGTSYSSLQSFATMGSTSANNKHVHFEVWQNSQRLQTKTEWIFKNTTGCTPPSSGQWTISGNCTISGNVTAPGNVLVQNNAVLTVPSGANLNINFTNNWLKVEPNGKVLVDPNGKIY